MPGRTVQRMERYFDFAALGATWRTEVLAGLTTFLTMAYIIFVNPAILSKTGMPIAAVTAATCLCAAFGSILMGVLARYPLALAPGMGLNAYFTYTVCLKMHIPWQTALGAVFLSGVIFLLLTFGGIRQLLVEAIPRELHASVAGGVGLFIAFIGLIESGIVVRDPDTVVALGNLRAPGTALALFGLLLIAVLQILKVRASILIGIAGTLLTGYIFGQVHWAPQHFALREMTATVGKLDIRGALHTGALEIIFVFLFVDLFDNVGTLVAVTKKGRADRSGRQDSAALAHLLCRCDRDSCRFADRHQHRVFLHRVIGGRGRWRKNGHPGNRYRLVLLCGAVRRSTGRADPQRRDGARAHHCGRTDGGLHCRGGLGRSAGRHSRVPHAGNDPADLFHCKRPRHRHQQLRAAAAVQRQSDTARLAVVRAGRAVHRAVRLPCEELGVLRH